MRGSSGSKEKGNRAPGKIEEVKIVPIQAYIVFVGVCPGFFCPFRREHRKKSQVKKE